MLHPLKNKKQYYYPIVSKSKRRAIVSPLAQSFVQGEIFVELGSSGAKVGLENMRFKRFWDFEIVL